MADPTSIPSDADAHLRRFHSTRSPDDFAALFDATAPSLFRVAVRLTRDGAAAEDVLQETFLAILRAGGTWDPSRAALPWMTGILERKAADAWRRRERDRRPLPRPECSDGDPRDEAEKDELRDSVRCAIEDLDEPFRRVAVLRWRYGLEPGEIADALGENPGTVRSNLSRAKQRLERRLRPSLLAPLLGLPSRRGLDTVRAEVMSEAASLLAPVAASVAAAALTTGGAVMAKKVLISSVVVLLLAIGVGRLITKRDRAIPAPDEPLTSEEKPAAVPSASPDGHPGSEAQGTASEDLPPPVDLSACDRDRDIFGTTVDDEGIPVPGAEVVAIRFPWRRGRLAPMDAHHLEEEGCSTRSAVDGTFVLHFDRGEQVDIRATADGFGPGEVTRCQAGERVTVFLRKGGPALEVRCTDEAGRAVAGARLTFWKRNSTSVYGAMEFQRTGVTDDTGRYTFAHLTPGRSTVKVEHDRFGNPGWSQPEIPADGVISVTVVFPEERTVAGRITNAATGKALPGARVGRNWVMNRPVTTDAEGRYVFPGWKGKGVTFMTAAAEGYGSMNLRVPDSGDLDFALEPAFSARGRVVDADGSLVAGARVGAAGSWKDGDRSGYDRSAATTDADGEFILRDLSYRAAHAGAVEAKGHGRISFEVEAPPDGSTETDIGDLALTASRAIEGRALDPDGKPLVGCDVNLASLLDRDSAAERDPRSGNSRRGMGEVRRTDDLGRFRFPDLSPGRWGLKLAVPGSPIVDIAVDLRADRDLLDVVLAQKGRSLTFLVTDESGRPLSGITVMSPMVFPHPSSGVRGRTSIQAVTDASGRARFQSVPNAGRQRGSGVRYRVQPYTGDSAPPWAVRRTEPIVAAGQEVRVILQPVGWIRGKVLDAEGNPIPGLHVGAHGEDSRSVGGGTCDATGAFAIRVPKGPTVTLRVLGGRRVERPGNVIVYEQTTYRGERLGVSAPGFDILVRVAKLPEDQALSVLVLDHEGAPVADYPIRAIGPGANTFEGQPAGKTDAQGRLRWEGLLGDKLTLLPSSALPAGLPEGVIPPRRLEIVPAGQDVTLRFRRGVLVAGRVLRPDGTAAADAVVVCNTKEGGGKSLRTGEDGRFRFWYGAGEIVTIEAAWGDGRGGIFQTKRETRAGQDDLELRLVPVQRR